MAGTLTISTLSDGTNSTSATNAIKGSAKAWVNFNGTGTVAIRASHNVSSITDNGTGIYTVNFTTAFADVNYATQVTAGRTSGEDGVGSLYGGTYSTSAVQICTTYASSAGLQDAPIISVSCFR